MVLSSFPTPDGVAPITTLVVVRFAVRYAGVCCHRCRGGCTIVKLESSSWNLYRWRGSSVHCRTGAVSGEEMGKEMGKMNHDKSRDSFWGRTIRASHYLSPPSCFYSPIPSSSELEPPTSLWKGEGRMQPGPRFRVN
jgi:hypothetical protein